MVCLCCMCVCARCENARVSVRICESEVCCESV